MITERLRPQPTRVLVRPLVASVAALSLALWLVLGAAPRPIVEVGNDPAPVLRPAGNGAAPAAAPTVTRDQQTGPQNADKKLNAGQDRGAGYITGGPLTGPGLGSSGNDRRCPGSKECAP